MAYKRLRLRRINRLLEHGFSKQEARQLTGMRTVYPDGSIRVSTIILNRPYIRMMMRDRRRKLRQADKEGLSRAEFFRRTYQDYLDKGWITPTGDIDYWKEFRYYYNQAVRLGAYKPPPEKRTYDPNKPHKKKTADGLIDREHVRRQAAKYRAKTEAVPRAVSGDRAVWIEQLKASMKDAKTPEQREQFRQQIIRLGGQP